MCVCVNVCGRIRQIMSSVNVESNGEFARCSKKVYKNKTHHKSIDINFFLKNMAISRNREKLKIRADT